jgi:hypothetical protein
MTLQCPLAALCRFRPPVWPPLGYCAGAGRGAWLSAACCCLAAGPHLPPCYPRSDPCWQPCGGVRWCPHAQPAPCLPAFLCLLPRWQCFGCAPRRPPLPHRPLRPIPRLPPVLTPCPPARLRCLDVVPELVGCTAVCPQRVTAPGLCNSQVKSNWFPCPGPGTCRLACPHFHHAPLLFHRIWPSAIAASPHALIPSA